MHSVIGPPISEQVSLIEGNAFDLRSLRPNMTGEIQRERRTEFATGKKDGKLTRDWDTQKFDHSTGKGFDAAVVLHVGMYLKDKGQLFREIAAAVRAGARIGVYDIMTSSEEIMKGGLQNDERARGGIEGGSRRIGEAWGGTSGEGGSSSISFPLPWASHPSQSFVESSASYVRALEAAGLRIVHVRGRRREALKFFDRAERRHKVFTQKPEVSKDFVSASDEICAIYGGDRCHEKNRDRDVVRNDYHERGALSGSSNDGGCAPLPPPLGLHLLVDDFPRKIKNLRRAIVADLIEPVEIIAEKPLDRLNLAKMDPPV